MSNDALRDALRWYEKQVRDCRKISADGEIARQALDNDGGLRARAALAQIEDVAAPAQSVEPVAYAMHHDTGPDKGLSWTADNEMFGPQWQRVPLYATPPSAEGARDAALMSDIREYLEDGLETPGFAEAQGSIEARALIARIDAIKSKKEAQ